MARHYKHRHKYHNKEKHKSNYSFIQRINFFLRKNSVIIIILFLLIIAYFNQEKITSSLTEISQKINSELGKVQTSTTQPSKLRVIPSDCMAWYGTKYCLESTSFRSCANVEAIGEANGVLNNKQKICRTLCGIKNMDYHSYDCEKDFFVCYCIN